MKYEYTISSRDIKREVERLKNAQNEGLILTWFFSRETRLSLSTTVFDANAEELGNGEL